MSITRRDYILRLIEQLAEMLGRIVGLRKSGKLEEAEKMVRAVGDGLLGSSRTMIDSVDSSTAANLLGSREKIAAYAALTVEEAEIAEARGQTSKAAGRRRRALELYLEASRLGALDAHAQANVGVLRTRVGSEKLDVRYRELIDKIPTKTN